MTFTTLDFQAASKQSGMTFFDRKPLQKSRIFRVGQIFRDILILKLEGGGLVGSFIIE